MAKRLLNFSVLFILGMSFLITAIIRFSTDVNIDLGKSKVIIGQVAASETRQISKGLRGASTKRIFYLKLNNSPLDFALRRSYEGYEDLKSKIKIGDSIKIYYRDSKQGNDRNIVQLEKNEDILENYKDYEANASTTAGISLFLGIVLTIGSILWIMKFNLLKFLTSWVEG